jgi:hypothetical protein
LHRDGVLDGGFDQLGLTVAEIMAVQFISLGYSLQSMYLRSMVTSFVRPEAPLEAARRSEPFFITETDRFPV